MNDLDYERVPIGELKGPSLEPFKIRCTEDDLKGLLLDVLLKYFFYFNKLWLLQFSSNGNKL